MVAFGPLQWRLLRAGGAALILTGVMSAVYNADTIAPPVPVVGVGMATALTYREFRRRGTDAATATAALALAGAVSTVAFAIIVAVGAGLLGNPVAATLSIVGRLSTSCCPVSSSRRFARQPCAPGCRPPWPPSPITPPDSASGLPLSSPRPW